MRVTKEGQGWRRFLVFAELTKSKKGVNYIALFVYFQFKSALLIILAQGPRIALNAMTLYAVMQAQIIPGGDHAAEERSNFEQFFMNIKTMIDTGNKQETVIYFTMLFSLVVWVIAALSLIISALLYIFFLWHYIPRDDGGLTKYCRRKVEARLERIVGKKIKKAIEKQNAQIKREEQKAIEKGELDVSKTRPTLPKLDRDDDDQSTVFSLQRSDTMSTNTTLPPYSTSNAPSYSSNAPSRSNTNNTIHTVSSGRSLMKPSLPTLDERPGMPAKSNTQFTNLSNTSYGSNAPMLSQAGNMGRSSPAPPMPPLDRNGTGYFGEYQDLPYPSERPYTSQDRVTPMQRGPLPPVDTSFYNDPHAYESNDFRGPPRSQSTRPYQEFSPYDNRGPQMGPSYELSPVSPTEDISRHYFADSNGSDEYQPPQMPSTLRSGSPAVSQPVGLPSQPRAGTAPPRAGVPASLQTAIQRRELSQPLPNRGMGGSAPPQQMRSATAPLQQQQPNWGPNRSYTPNGPPRNYTPSSAAPRGYGNSYGY
jgi:hypothetical protein